MINLRAALSIPMAIAVSSPTQAQSNITPVEPTVTNPPWQYLKNQCVARSQKPIADFAEKIVGAAIDEWSLFRQQTGVEATWSELKGADFKDFSSSFAWARVYKYWDIARAKDTLDLKYRVKFDSNGQPIRSQGEISFETIELEKALGNLSKASQMPGSILTAAESEAIRAATIRSSLMDKAWSAVFISTVMQISGLTQDQFPSARAHKGYIDFALSALKGTAGTENSAYIACPPDSDVIVRVGDLICNLRANNGSYSNVWNSRIPASHCDVVVQILAKNGGFEIHSIGGNLSDTVRRTVHKGTGAKPNLASVPRDKNAQWIAVLSLRPDF